MRLTKGLIVPALLSSMLLMSSAQPSAGQQLTQRFQAAEDTELTLPPLRFDESTLEQDMGLVFGAFLGFAAGVFVAYLVGSKDCEYFGCFAEAIYTAPIGMIAGAVFGYWWYGRAGATEGARLIRIGAG